MQICAIDEKGTYVYADRANKHQDYQCIECGQILRLRHGIHRQAHYFHIQPNRICRQHAKGMPHLMLQQLLKKKLPDGEVELECSFTTISRIADVAWHTRRLIFEIQCSPISAEEVQSRNQHYASVGYQVVWIFHDDRYNQYRLSGAEKHLGNHPYYFTNINAEGKGEIYDQLAITTSHGFRTTRFPRLPINLAEPKLLSISKTKSYKRLPFPIKQRIKASQLIFSGDTVDHYLDPKKEAFDNLPLESKLRPNLLFDFLKRIRRFYISGIRLIIERACR